MGSTVRGGVRVVCVIAMLATAAHASPSDLFGFGGRSPGMAGTGVATANGYDAAYINPAGLGGLRDKRITLGGVYGDFSLSMDGDDTGTESVKAVIFGGALPIPLGGVLKDRVGFGIGFFVPTRVINRARASRPGQPVFALLETRAQVVGLQLALGIQVTDRLSLGAGVITLATLDGVIDVSTDATGRFATRSQQELVTRLTPVVGARYALPKRNMQLGFVFRGVVRTDYQITVTNDLADSLPITIPVLTIGGTSQYDPLTLAIEDAWQVSPKTLLLLQLAYQRWSAYPLPTINPTSGTAPQEPPGFHDTVVPRLAAQYTAYKSRTTGVVLRTGYFYAASPAPEMDGKQSLLDNNRHVFTAGLGVYFPGTKAPVHLDFWVQGHFLQPRQHTKDPSNFGPDDELPFDTISTSGRIFIGGMTVGLDI